MSSMYLYCAFQSSVEFSALETIRIAMSFFAGSSNPPPPPESSPVQAVHAPAAIRNASSMGSTDFTADPLPGSHPRPYHQITEQLRLLDRVVQRMVGVPPR